MGTEKPFAGRKRISVDYLTRGEKVGRPGISEHKVKERRLTYSLSYALNPEWIFAASLPLVTKEVDRFDLAREKASGLGDLDLSARWFVGKDKHFPAKNVWGLQFGLRLPTSSEQKAGNTPIDFDAQPGAGATVPSIGAWYGRFMLPWFFYTSATFQHATSKGYQGYDAGDVFLVTGLSQYAFNPQLALQISLDARWKQEDQYHDVEDPDSGGLLVMASPGFAWTPITDLVVNMNYQLPAIENVNGRQEEDPTLRAGVTYDF